MDRNNPFVSICVPAYNVCQYINETLSCILNQTYKNFEIIICDDSSTDETISVIKSFYDNRIILIKNKNKGASSARNEAFSISKGELIIFFDSDDLIPNNFLESQINYYLKCKKKTVIYSSIGRFYNNDIATFKIDEKQDLGDYDFSEWIRIITKSGPGLNVPGRYLIPRILIEAQKPWDENLTLNDDFPFFTKIYQSANQVKLNKEVALLYRSGNKSLSTDWTRKSIHSYWASLNNASSIILENHDLNDSLRCCASLYQIFVYNVYPDERSLVRQAEVKIKEFGGSPYKKKIRGITGILSRIIGWKQVKVLKRFITRIG